jgi:NTE family protein
MGSRLVIAVNLSTDVYGGTVIQHMPRPGPAVLQDLAIEGSRDSTLRKMLGRENDPGLTTVLVTAFNITQDRLARSRLAGDPPDITIVPRTPSIGLFEFDRAAEAISAGRLAAERALPEIERSLALLEAVQL